MLNRVLNFTRRQKPQAFSPRKRAMASTWFGTLTLDKRGAPLGSWLGAESGNTIPIGAAVRGSDHIYVVTNRNGLDPADDVHVSLFESDAVLSF